MFIINAIKFCINLPWCAKWYVFGLIGSILYLPLAAFFFFFGLQKVENKIFTIRNQVDDFIVCNTGYNILRYSNEIRDGCYFQKPIRRKCASDEDFDPLKEMGDLISDLFSDLTTFNFITVVNVLAILLFLGLVILYFLNRRTL
jgi:ABC-type transport system involved in multi-copper enzyme maturation permease subunit